MERIGTDQREQHVFDQAARGATGRILSGCQKQNDRFLTSTLHPTDPFHPFRSVFQFD
jgi:hypothetical protein